MHSLQTYAWSAYTPALLTMMSSPPNRSTAACTVRSMSASRVTSHSCGVGHQGLERARFETARLDTVRSGTARLETGQGAIGSRATAPLPRGIAQMRLQGSCLRQGLVLPQFCRQLAGLLAQQIRNHHAGAFLSKQARGRLANAWSTRGWTGRRTALGSKWFGRPGAVRAAS